MEELREYLPAKIYKRLQLANIETIEQFLIKPKQEICNATRLPEKDVSMIINIILQNITKIRFTKVTDLKRETFLTTGCSEIDSLIKGIRTSGITEIYGESATGKTQIALQLALKVQQTEENGGLNAGCVFICTEDKFPSKRLHQIRNYFPPLQNDTNKLSAEYEDNIFIEHAEDVDQLKHCFSVRLPVLFRQKTIRLIVIDSIAGPFRYDNTKDYETRSKCIKFVVQKLYDLSNDFDCAVVCTNQVTADMVKGGYKPSLGLEWSNFVQTRLEVYRVDTTVAIGDQIYPVRKLRVVFSPFAPKKTCHFIVANTGLVNCNTNE